MDEIGLLTVAEAADELGKKPRDVQRYVKNGHLTPVTKVGRAFLFDPEDIKTFTPPKPGYPKGKPWTGKRKKKRKSG
jgi:excisionase family DNA binding protein